MNLIIKKYKLNKKTNKHVLLKTIKDVPEDQVFVEMVMTPLPVSDNPNQLQSWMYEAGKMDGDTFCIELVWQSENGDLFE